MGVSDSYEERGRYPTQLQGFKIGMSSPQPKEKLLGIFSDWDPSTLGRLGPVDAIKLFGALLWCSARRWSVPLNAITITSRVDVPDGGIDADIQPNSVTT